MDKMMGMCGMDCSSCPTYIATVKNDDNERAKVAAMWSKMFKTEIKPSDINCDGCLSGSKRIFGHCKTCEVRICGMDKNVRSCAKCPSYSCSKLDEQLARIPKTARENLEKMHGSA